MRRTIAAAAVSVITVNALKMTSQRGAFILFEGTVYENLETLL